MAIQFESYITLFSIIKETELYKLWRRLVFIHNFCFNKVIFFYIYLIKFIQASVS